MAYYSGMLLVLILSTIILILSSSAAFASRISGGGAGSGGGIGAGKGQQHGDRRGEREHAGGEKGSRAHGNSTSKIFVLPVSPEMQVVPPPWSDVAMPIASFFADFEPPQDALKWNQALMQASRGEQVLLKKVLEVIKSPFDLFEVKKMSTSILLDIRY